MEDMVNAKDEKGREVIAHIVNRKTGWAFVNRRWKTQVYSQWGYVRGLQLPPGTVLRFDVWKGRLAPDMTALREGGKR